MTISRTCCCRPSCLWQLTATDATVDTAQGPVLTAHLLDAPYPYDTTALTSLASPLSVVKR